MYRRVLNRDVNTYDSVYSSAKDLGIDRCEFSSDIGNIIPSSCLFIWKEIVAKFRILRLEGCLEIASEQTNYIENLMVRDISDIQIFAKWFDVKGDKIISLLDM